MMPRTHHEDIAGPPAQVEVPVWVTTGERATHGRSLRPIHVLLFLATLFTTTLAGSFQAGVNPLDDLRLLVRGLPFSATLMGILLVHEMGHFLMSRLHGVEATPPYFIPGPPFLIGTFGAFIRMRTPTNRKALFDVGAAGPWAGFLVSIPAVFYGLSLSEVRALDTSTGGLVLGDSLVFRWLTRLALGVSPADVIILLHPIALAGWFGLFITFLNLLPVGQLDGGHVVYALIGRRHRWVARCSLLVIIGLAFLGWQGWVMWAVLVTVLGLDHPPTIDDTPLDPRRRVAGWLTIALFVVTFMPVPLRLV
ncbi:MAG: putative Peptidase [Deltaproteobacteria bacterium]|nr:putative Peptidase [Deltaproteobacteria bacterium]